MKPIKTTIEYLKGSFIFIRANIFFDFCFLRNEGARIAALTLTFPEKTIHTFSNLTIKQTWKQQIDF